MSKSPLTPIRVGFVLLSREDSPIPSTRISVLNMFPFLIRHGIEPLVIFQPDSPTEQPDVSGLGERAIAEKLNIVVFQKVHGSSVKSLIEELRSNGIKTVYEVCDLVETDMAAVANATIVVTDYLKSLYPIELREKIHVVHDGIEHPECCKSHSNQNRGSLSHPLNAVLVTSATIDCLPSYFPLPKWLSLTIVGRYPEKSQKLQRIQEARWNILSKQSLIKKYDSLRFYLNRKIHTESWDARKVYDQMCFADIGIIPIEVNNDDREDASWRVKSENRLTMKMAVGLPVIASPIPSYKPVIVQGKNGFLASSRDEWMKYLSALRDPATRERIGKEAQRSVRTRYSMEEQANRFISVLKSLA